MYVQFCLHSCFNSSYSLAGQEQQFSGCPEHHFRWIHEVKTIFIIAVRCCLPFSHLFSHEYTNWMHRTEESSHLLWSLALKRLAILQACNSSLFPITTNSECLAQPDSLFLSNYISSYSSHIPVPLFRSALSISLKQLFSLLCIHFSS